MRLYPLERPSFILYACVSENWKIFGCQAVLKILALVVLLVSLEKKHHHSVKSFCVFFLSCLFSFFFFFVLTFDQTSNVS